LPLARRRSRGFRKLAGVRRGTKRVSVELETILAHPKVAAVRSLGNQDLATVFGYNSTTDAFEHSAMVARTEMGDKVR
jgi:hypothetical protein